MAHLNCTPSHLVQRLTHPAGGALLLGTVLLIAAMGVSPARGQSYTLRATHAGASHSPMTGGAFQVQGTAGQPATRITGDGSPFYLGAGFWHAVRSEDAPLPVELTAFTARRDGDQTRLTWTTASETNNAGFEVQRSVEGRWTPIGFVEGRGTTTEPQTYRFTDSDLPFTATGAVYRLRQVDTDGTETLSEAVEITRAAPATLALHGNFPNPFARQTTIRYELPKAGPVQIVVYDALGRHVATLVDREQAAGHKQVTFDARRLASGLYFARLVAESGVRTQRLTVVR